MFDAPTATAWIDDDVVEAADVRQTAMPTWSGARTIGTPEGNEFKPCCGVAFESDGEVAPGELFGRLQQHRGASPGRPGAAARA